MYETDVLVIGGGNGGLTAAIEASDRGADVIMVDKGPLGRSGSSGTNWGNWCLTELENPGAPQNADELVGRLVWMSRGLDNQKTLRSQAEVIYKFKTGLWIENTGSLCLRVPPGNVAFIPGTTTVMHVLYPWVMAQRKQKTRYTHI